MSPPTLHLIDGHSQVFRAYHAIRDGLSTSTGIPTNATFGFLNTLRTLIAEERPSHLIVTFDAGHAARSEMYEAYKSNRAETPPDLAEQLPWIERVLEALGVRTVRIEGQEADDVIATLTRQARARGFEVKILSNDKDLFQLVGEGVTVMRTQPRGPTLRCDAGAVQEKMGVPPERITDLLGLMGDSVDCIPGVPGVGEKTAAKLIAEHGDLEAVLASAAAIKQPKLRENLQAHAETARLSKRLATLDDAVPGVAFDPETCAWSLRPNPRLTALLRELEFGGLLEAWGGTPAPAETMTETLATAAALRAFAEKARRAPLLALDTETDDLDPVGSPPVGISMSIEPGQAVYIPIGHRQMGERVDGQVTLDEVREILGPVLADERVPKAGQNLKFDLKVLQAAGLALRGIVFDTLIASHCLNPDRRGHGLKELSLERLGVSQTPISDLIGTGKSQITMSEVDVATAARYAGQDADMTLRLALQMREEMEEQGLADLFSNLEMPLIEVLAAMEVAGVAIDAAQFEALRAEITARLAELTHEIHRMAGRPFNIASTPQLREVLFEELRLPVIKKTKTGASTDVEVLEALAPEHPLPAKILEHRSLEKLLGTYVDALPRLIHPRTKRLHTTFHQMGAATGRLSSSDPNLQNIPVRSEMGRRLRAGFVPRSPGWVLMAADYSQIELRIAAHLSGDEAMCEAFTRGEDIHRATAARVAGVAPEAVTPEQREAAKRVTFGILYGISAHRLAMDLKISRAEGQALIDQCFASFPGVKAWIDQTLAEARERGYVTTLLGRRRFVPDIQSRNFNLRAAAERVAVNTPVQGSAADLIKVAMVRLSQRLRREGLRAVMCVQVHDELIFDLPGEEVERLRPIVVETMAGALPLRVPVVVDVSVGRSWAEC